MKNWSIRARIIASFGLMLLLIAIATALSYTRLRKIDTEAASVRRDSVPQLYLATTMRGAWAETFLNVGKLLVSDEVNPNAARDANARIDEAMRNLSRLTHDYEGLLREQDDIRRYARFKAARGRYEQVLKQIVERFHSDRAGALALYNGQLSPLWDEGRVAINAIVEDSRASAEESSALIQLSVNDTVISTSFSLLAIMGVALASGYLLFRSVMEPLRELAATIELMRSGDLTRRVEGGGSAEFGLLGAGFNRMSEEITALVGQAQKSSVQVSTAVAAIAATSKEQQATAAETAATTAEIGATSQQIYATSRDLVRTMGEVGDVAGQAAALAGTGQEGLTRMGDTMHQVMDAAGSVNAKLAILNEKAGNINQVIATITKVADQTNLLSLNAAIEAEKAGEYGRGFGVVATEIRRLADRTAVATYDIEQMVREMQSAVSAGVMGMDKFAEEVRRGMQEVQMVGNQLSQVIGQVQMLAPRFAVVSDGVQDQAHGAEQITQALSQLSEGAQQTVESMRQSNQSIDELTLVANQLRAGVTRFRVHG